MGQGFGREMPAPHVQAEHRAVTRYLLIVSTPDGSVAKLLRADRVQVAEFDANTEEVTTLMAGRTPAVGATGPEWDALLAAHSAQERAAVQVFTLSP